MRRWGSVLIGMILTGCGGGPATLSPSSTLQGISNDQWRGASLENKIALVSNARGGVNPDTCPASDVVAAMDRTASGANQRAPFLLYQPVLAARRDRAPTYGPNAASPAPGAAVTAWYATNGYILTSIAGDNQRIGAAAGAQDLAGMGAACDGLAADIRTAQGMAPIPDANAAAHFATALQFEAFGSQDCSRGAADGDVRSLRNAVMEFNLANDELDLATAALRRLAG